MNQSGSLPNDSYRLISATIRGGTHLLLNAACSRIAIEALDGLRRSGRVRLFGFVLLPSRMDFLCRPAGGSLPAALSRFEEYTSRRMLQALQRRGRTVLMQHLHSVGPVPAPEASVWNALQIRAISEAREAAAALDRLHRMPTAAPWRLADAPEEYPFSSACFYGAGREAAIVLDDLRMEPGCPVSPG